MKENGLSVLMFLFDNYLMGEGFTQEGSALASELEDIGFHAKEISKAFNWLDELAILRESPTFLLGQHSSKSFRAYTSDEVRKLNHQCRGFLLSLEQMKVLDPLTREIIIDRSMALEANPFTLQQFKRIVGLIMINRAQQEDTLWLEDLICDFDEVNVLH